MTSVDHHFVPVGLLRRWSIGGSDTLIKGYYWDHRRSRLAWKTRGPKGFCYQPHLLTVRGHPKGDDYYERSVFGTIDDIGADVVNDLLTQKQLPPGKRLQFTEYLLSLEARRPAVVEAIRTHGAATIAKMLNSDPLILEAAKREGYSVPPSEAHSALTGIELKDHVVHVVQLLAKQSKFADVIANAHWQVRWADPHGSKFALGDRPLIRFNGTGEDMVWVLPLSPDALFIATGSEKARQQIAEISHHQLVRSINSDSAMQCDQYVFWTQDSPTAWLARRLALRHLQPKQSPGDLSIPKG
jgi:hypothetical protein